MSVPFSKGLCWNPHGYITVEPFVACAAPLWLTDLSAAAVLVYMGGCCNGAAVLRIFCSLCRVLLTRWTETNKQNQAALGEDFGSLFWEPCSSPSTIQLLGRLHVDPKSLGSTHWSSSWTRSDSQTGSSAAVLWLLFFFFSLFFFSPISHFWFLGIFTRIFWRIMHLNGWKWGSD